jgi:chemotaxis protein methyltransferase CheR
MTPQQFQLISELLKERSGLVLSEEKGYLVQSRLMPVARKWGMSDVDELAAALDSRPDPKLVDAVVEAMTTNESFFFRDTKPFDQFRDVILPQLIEARANQRRIRIWCAAASSGQEPYSLAIILKEAEANLQGWNLEIVGTDISTEILARARLGIYSQFEVQRGLPIQLLVKYFHQQDDKWEIDASIRAMVKYQEFNLLDDLSPLGHFDVVFCRNVLIYFDKETKAKVLESISQLLPQDGMLYLGGAETVLGLTDKFAPLDGERGIYGITQGVSQPQAAAV